MIRDNTDCPYLHDIFDQYCNLFKGYKKCSQCDCEVLKILKENEQLKQENEQLKKHIEKRKCCNNCKSKKLDDFSNCQFCDEDYSRWELAE